MTVGVLGLAFLLLCLAAEPAEAAPGELLAVPEPALERLEPAVREQLREARDALDTVLGDPAASAAERAEAFGELGRLYQLFERWGSAEAALRNARGLAPEEFAWTYSLAVLLQETGRTDEARALLEESAGLDPSYLAVPVRLGDLLTASGDAEGAERWYRRALELQPEAAAAHYGLGRLALQRGDPQGAIGRFETALDQQPEATAIRHPLALAWRKAGDLERAKAALSEAGGQPPKVSDPLIRGLSALSEGATIHVRVGNRARRQGLVEEALAQYEKAAALDPGNSTAQYNAGALLVRAGRTAEAERRFRAALKADPGYIDARVNLALVLRDRGEAGEAVEHLRRVAEADPADLRARFELVRTLLVLASRDPGSRATALAEVEERLEALAGTPGGEALAALGRADVASLRGDVAAEARHLGTAVAADPGLAEAWIRLGSSRLRSGRADAAQTAFASAVRADADRPEAWLGLAEASLHRDDPDPDTALDALSRAHELRPAALEPAEALARLLATHPDPARRDGERAIRLVEPWLERAPGPRRVETLAMALAAAGRGEDAVKWQERLLDEARRAGVGGDLVAGIEGNLERYRAGEVAELSW